MTDFFNQLIAGLNDPRRAFYHQTKHKQIEEERNWVRQELLKANKVRISDSLLLHAQHASMVAPHVLADMFAVAKPPFENMWIEWNERKRMEIVYDLWAKMLGGRDKLEPRQEVAEVVGYHVWHLESGGSPTPLYHQYSLEAGGKLMAPFSAMYASQDHALNWDWVKRWSIMETHDPSKGMKEEEAKRRSFETQRVTDATHYLGNSYVEYWMDKERFEGRNRRALSHLYEHIAAGVHEASVMQLGDKKMLETLMRTHAMERKVYDSDLRFLISVLALLNYPHHIIQRTHEPVEPRIAYGRRVPRNEVRVLEIELPKPRGTKRYERMFGGASGSPRRQHVRRGHWRNYHHKDGTVTRRWIKEQIVGNASVGIIDHEYELVKKGTDR